MSGEEVSPYTHQLAIKLSQALNNLTPNDLLAQRVTEIAKSHDAEGFMKGAFEQSSGSMYGWLTEEHAAARTFGLGKLKDSYLSELHSEILTHAKQEETGVAPQPMEGITVHDSDVLQPEPMRPGGLQRKETVRPHSVHSCSWLTVPLPQRHQFRPPPKPLEPPTPRTSILGLDRLAKEKRAAAAAEEGQRKKPRLDDDSVFKGAR